MKKMDKIKNYIKQILISKAMDDTLPMDMTELDVDGLFDLAKACVKAEKYLNSDEASIVDQVRAIVSEQEYEPTTIIDYIEGVQTIYKFEFTFTVKDFLEQIGYSN